MDAQAGAAQAREALMYQWDRMKKDALAPLHQLTKRVHIADRLADLSDAATLVKPLLSDWTAKRCSVEAIVRAQMASNTSSLSVTALQPATSSTLCRLPRNRCSRGGWVMAGLKTDAETFMD
jgi:3-hydroxyacyl-CoA dehydrogenase